MRLVEDDFDGGWALTADALADGHAYVRHPALSEPSYAIADAWEPPHPLSLPEDLCEAMTGGLRPDHEVEIVRRFEAANRIWWGLDLTEWESRIERHEVGDAQPTHQYVHPGAARCKFAGVVQLSEPDTYQGGAVVVRAPLGLGRVEMPRIRGTLIAFPGWTVHEVEPVTAGTRWSLCVNGRGPRLR